MVLLQMLCVHSNAPVSVTLMGKMSIQYKQNLYVPTMYTPAEGHCRLKYKLCTSHPHTLHLLLSLPACCFALSHYVFLSLCLVPSPLSSISHTVEMVTEVRGRGGSDRTFPRCGVLIKRPSDFNTHSQEIRCDNLFLLCFLLSFPVFHFEYCMCVFGFTKSGTRSVRSSSGHLHNYI